jgi:hypothetical protein
MLGHLIQSSVSIAVGLFMRTAQAGSADGAGQIDNQSYAKGRSPNRSYLRRSGFCDQQTVKQHKDHTLNRDEQRSQLRL